MAKISRADAYRKQTAERFTAEEVELPSGAVFLLRRPQLSVWVMSGELPMTVSAAMQKQYRTEEEAAQAFMALSVADQEKAAGFLRKLVVWTCLEPRISETPDGDSILFSELEQQDLAFLIEWAKSAGGATADAANFRAQRRQSALAGADGAKHRAKAQRPDRN